MRPVVKEERHRLISLHDLQDLDLVVRRRVTPGRDEVPVSEAELDTHGPALVRDGLLDESVHAVGEPLSVVEVVRVDLDGCVVVVRREEDEPRRVDPHLVPESLPENGRGDVEAVQVVRDDDQTAYSVVQHQHPGVDVLGGSLGHAAVHHHARLGVRDDRLRHSRAHLLRLGGLGRQDNREDHRQG